MTDTKHWASVFSVPEAGTSEAHDTASHCAVKKQTNRARAVLSKGEDYVGVCSGYVEHGGKTLMMCGDQLGKSPESC